jgi:hypothetical protein
VTIIIIIIIIIIFLHIPEVRGSSFSPEAVGADRGERLWPFQERSAKKVL